MPHGANPIGVLLEQSTANGSENGQIGALAHSMKMGALPRSKSPEYEPFTAEFCPDQTGHDQ